MICRFCGLPVEADDLLHALRCDGQQGRVEAAAALWPPGEAAPPDTTTITRPRETSVQAFYNAVDSGVIETRREQVYAALRALGVATSNEVFERMKQDYQGPRYISTVAARFTELRDLGLIYEVGSRPCLVTRQTCITWAVVSAADYVGPAVVHRCATCGQIVSRDVPVLEAAPR